VQKAVAALRLARQRKLHRQGARKQPRDVEQMRLVAACELKLDLAKPHRRGAGLDRPLVEREFDDSAVALERKHNPAHPWLELRFELALELAGQKAVEGRVARLHQVGLAVRDFALPFVADQDVGILRRLDRLYVAIADPAYAQRQAMPPQLLLVA